MREFKSIAEMAAFFTVAAEAQALMERRALSKAAGVVQRHAKRKIGKYQPQAGEFVGWAELAESTKSDRERKGFSEDDPLLRTGELRESIQVAMSTDGTEAQIGSNSDIAVYQELGTVKMPPRSFLGSAMVEKLDEVKEIISGSVKAALLGEKVYEGKMDIE